jgi:carbon starvation protein
MMTVLAILVVAAALLGLAYRFYGSLLARRVMQLDDSRPTPAHTMRDDRDYVPTHPAVLFGHHFASISGLGPLLGPAIAVIWGWLPALIWILLGSIFVGAVHDIGCLFTSIRHKARSIGDITEEVMSHRARVLFLLFAIFAMSLAMGVFVLNIAQLFSPGEGGAESGHVPEAVLPSLMLIVIAITAGILRYRFNFDLLPLTIVGVAASLFFVWLGTIFPLSGIGGIAFTPSLWTYALMVYAYLASVLPVWLLLQPRDYINSFQLFLGMGLLFVGVLIGGLSGNLRLAAPAVNFHAENLPPIFPMLFITVACGAVSGFHSLVASGTTSKQLDRESHALPVAYGGMLTEGLLATLALLGVAAGFTAVEWAQNYADWKLAGAKALSNFVHGAGFFVAQTGVPHNLAKVFVATVAIGFALTTLDTATRLIRYNIQELGTAFRLKPITNPYIATGIAVLLIGFFALLKIPDPVTGQLKPAGTILWALFGTSNQLLAGLALLVVTLYLRSLGRPTVFTAAPMGFMLVVTISALLLSIRNFFLQANWFLLGFSCLILALAIWLLVEAVLTLKRQPVPA